MKVIAYYIIHYGKDYLSYSIRSIYESVDEIVIFYTDRPSHSSGTLLKCPDSEQDLMQAAVEYDPENKVKWLKGNWNAENEHRGAAYNYAKANNADVLLAVDADEVWKPEILKELIQYTYNNNVGQLLVWMRHLWRSFDYVCDDMMRQARVHNMYADFQNIKYADLRENCIWHFGYARSFKDVEYKISIHGHRGEWRDSGWLENVYKVWPPTPDVHPTCANTWSPIPFNKELLPEFMRDHPYYNIEKIT
jgi:cellulose synthase/poly-beta-1,6-N-acetylglucosamine synthase-like glycosyltransferase